MTTDICGALERHPIESVREVLRQAENLFGRNSTARLRSGSKSYNDGGHLWRWSCCIRGSRSNSTGLALSVRSIGDITLAFRRGVDFCLVCEADCFFLAGYEPRLLSASAADERWTLIYVVEDLQRRICKNRKDIDASSNGFKLGFGLAFAAVPLGLVAFFMTPS